MYFKKFKTIPYEYEISESGERKVVLMRDITRNVRVRKEILSNITAYEYYDILEGETPEILAEKFYGSAEYHWVIMLANDRYDYIADFPLPLNQVENYTRDKYGIDNMYDTHHYVNDKGFVVDSDHPEAYPVSNLEHEDNVNESKRRIKVISKNILNRLTSQFEDLL